MDRVKISNLINRLGCGDELLYCTRVYINARIYGGAWIPMEIFLDFVFKIFTGQKQHCRASYVWERRYHAKKKAEVPADQISTEEAEESPTRDET